MTYTLPYHILYYIQGGIPFLLLPRNLIQIPGEILRGIFHYDRFFHTWFLIPGSDKRFFLKTIWIIFEIKMESCFSKIFYLRYSRQFSSTWHSRGMFLNTKRLRGHRNNIVSVRTTSSTSTLYLGSEKWLHKCNSNMYLATYN